MTLIKTNDNSFIKVLAELTNIGGIFMKIIYWIAKATTQYIPSITMIAMNCEIVIGV